MDARQLLPEGNSLSFPGLWICGSAQEHDDSGGLSAGETGAPVRSAPAALDSGRAVLSGSEQSSHRPLCRQSESSAVRLLQGASEKPTEHEGSFSGRQLLFVINDHLLQRAAEHLAAAGTVYAACSCADTPRRSSSSNHLYYIFRVLY